MIEMIVKYYNDGVWNYIDGVRKTSVADINTDDLIKKFNDDSEQGKLQTNCTRYPESTELLPVGVQMSNKAFHECDFNQLFPNEDLSGDGHVLNLFSPTLLEKGNYPAKVIMAFLLNDKNYDYVGITTNQSAYLMSDEGKTIERLV
jgi:hypothetical protein